MSFLASTDLIVSLILALVGLLTVIAARVVKSNKDNISPDRPEQKLDEILRLVRRNDLSIEALATQLAQHDRAVSQLVNSHDAKIAALFADHKEDNYNRIISEQQAMIARLERGK